MKVCILFSQNEKLMSYKKQLRRRENNTPKHTDQKKAKLSQLYNSFSLLQFK